MREQPSASRRRAVAAIACTVVAWASAPVLSLFVRSASATFHGVFAIVQFLLLALGLLWAASALRTSWGAGNIVGVVLSVVGLLLSGGTLVLVLVLIVSNVIIGR